MKVFLTRYALTNGIDEVEAELTHQPDRVEVKDQFGNYFIDGANRDWHLTLEGAMAKAERMRVTKILSLKKQLEKLEQLDFSKVKND